jgi:hypothetical protein
LKRCLRDKVSYRHLHVLRINPFVSVLQKEHCRGGRAMPKSTAAGVLPCSVPGGHHRTCCWPTSTARRPERMRRQRHTRRRGEAAVYSGWSPVAAAPCLASGGVGRRPWSRCTLDSAGRARASLFAIAEPKSTVFAAVGGPGRADCSTPLPPRGGADRRRPRRSGPRNGLCYTVLRHRLVLEGAPPKYRNPRATILMLS